MFAPTIQQQQQQQQKTKQSEPASSSAEDEALKWNTDCVYFLASPLTCKKGAECEYRHSEYARVNPRDCYYWLSGNCLNPKCGFRHPPLEAPAGGSVQPPPPHAAAHHPGVVKQPVPCVFFQKGMCAKGDMCSFMHAPGFRKQLPAEAKPAAAADDPRFSKKPVDNYTGEMKLPDAANLPKGVTAPIVASSGIRRDGRGVEEGYEPVVQKKVAGVTDGNHSTQLHNSSFHNGKDADEGMRESSPGFNVLVDNEAGDSEYYHVEDGYGRRSQERRSEYDPDFIALADGDGEWRRHHRVSSERGDRSGKRVYGEDERSENILASDLRYRLAKQRKVGSHDDDNDFSMERGYRDSRRNIPRESSVSSSRLQGRIKLRERSNGDEAQFDRRSERGRERGREGSEFSQGRLRDRIKGRLEENHSGNQERGLRAPWVRRRETEDEERSETKSSRREESKTGTSLGKRKSLEDDHPHKPSGDSFAAPLPFSEILKRKRAAASGGNSNNNKDQTREETMVSKEEAGDETKLVTEEKTEVVIEEPKPIHHEEVEVEEEEGTIQVEGGEEEEVYEGNEEEQAYEGEEVNEEYYYEEGYEEGGEYAYEEGEEVVYAAEEAAEGEQD